MRGILGSIMAGCAALALAGCNLGTTKSEKAPVAAVNHHANLSLGCYTVDLFDPYHLKEPAPETPPELAGFVGVWKDAAWNGVWCHDLYITEVRPDGTVVLLDAYGPYKPGKLEATVFKRNATIKDGVLRFTAIGGAVVSYELAGNGKYLVGKRLDALGRYEITMQKVDGFAMVPVPQANPARS